MQNIALIVAGGTGSRMNTDTPKQYLELGQKTVLEWTIDAFINHPNIDAIKVVINIDHLSEYKKISAKYDLLPHSIGGKDRQESVSNGLNDLIEFKPKNVLIHDAARPFISNNIISTIIEKLKYHEVVDVTTPVIDTTRTKDGNLVDRNSLKLAQTPQSFRFEVIRKLHNNYLGSQSTDDITLALKANLNIAEIEGEKMNFKITNNDDFAMAQALLQKKTRVGYGYDIHEFDYSGTKKSLPICGVWIDCGFGVKAHSDGDVGLHALVDAILGACGKGDIGDFFPPNDLKWKDANSQIFIKKCCQLLDELKATICNVDITIICEKPKLSEYKASMKYTVAKMLSISEDQVNIKATTSEKMGFIGREEGLSASATCTIEI